MRLKSPRVPLSAYILRICASQCSSQCKVLNGAKVLYFAIGLRLHYYVSKGDVLEGCTVQVLRSSQVNWRYERTLGYQTAGSRKTVENCFPQDFLFLHSAKPKSLRQGPRLCQWPSLAFLASVIPIRISRVLLNGDHWSIDDLPSHLLGRS